MGGLDECKFVRLVEERGMGYRLESSLNKRRGD